MLRTGYGFPSSPLDPLAFALTPDIVLLYWKLPARPNAPILEIKYMISQLSATQISPSAIGAQQFEGANYAIMPTDVVSCLSNPCSAKISNLRPSTEYKFWVRAIHESHLNMQFVDDAEGSSVEASVRTKDIAGTLHLDNIIGTAVVLRYIENVLMVLQVRDPTIAGSYRHVLNRLQTSLTVFVICTNKVW